MSNSESSFSSSKRWAAISALIIVAAIAVRVHWAAGFIPVDSAEYARVAHEISQGTFHYDRYQGPPVIPVRTGVVLPVAATMTLLGPSETQLAVYSLFSCALVILFIYLLSARMFGHLAAIIASIIWVFLPIEIQIATMQYPEIPATAFAFIGLYCTYIARTLDRSEPRVQVSYGLAGGLAFGASWLCRETVIYFVPFCLALMLFDFRNTKFKHLATWGGIAAGSLAVLVGEMLAYKIINGDWLYRFTAIHNNLAMYREFFFTEGARFGFEAGTPFWKAVTKRVAVDGPALMFLNLEFLFLPSFGAIAALYGVYRRDNRFYFMSALLVVLLIMFDGFSTSLQNYEPLPLFSRYFYPICVPAVILTGGMLAALVRSVDTRSVLRERPEPVFWGGIVILLLAIIIAWSTFRQARDYSGTWSAAEKYLAGSILSPKDRIHTDALSRNGLEFFWRYPKEMNITVYGEPGKKFTAQCGEYVLKNLSYNHWLTVSRGMWLTFRGFEVPAVVQEPPENWRVQWTNRNATLFKVVCGG